MDILELGATLQIKETISGDGKKNEGIIFENNTQDLKRRGHPGIVLIPAGSEDEVAYCAYMTSDPQRYKYNKEKYYVWEEGIKRTSYINLENLVRIKNNLRSTISELSHKECYEILKAICEYQTQYGENEVYKEIKDKIQAVIYLMEQNTGHKGITVDSHNVKMLEGVPREQWDLLMYTKYHGKYARKSEYEIKSARISRLKERIEDFAKHYNRKDARKTEKIKALYSDLKVFFGIGLEETMMCAIALLKATPQSIGLEGVEEIEKGLKDCSELEKEKQKAKIQKSEAKKAERKKEREKRVIKKQCKQRIEDIKKYGRRCKVEEPLKAGNKNLVGESR